MKSLPDVVRPEIPRSEYDQRAALAKELGWGTTNRSVKRLERFLWGFATDNKSFFRAR